MLEFRELTLEDKPRVDACARAHAYHLCEHCFTDLFIWRGHYQTKICFAEGFLLIQMQTAETGQTMYLAPVGEGNLAAAIGLLEQDAAERGIPFIMCSIAEEMKPRIEAVLPERYEYATDEGNWDYIGLLEQDAAERGIPFIMCSIAEEMKPRIEAVLPERYEYATDEGNWDYIYLSEKLQTLSGKKLQTKRNLVNRFLAAYEGRWTYEDITPENTHDAFNFHIKWCEQNGCMREQAFWGETCAIGIALNHFEALDLRGGILRLDGEVIAEEFCGLMAR